MALRAIGGVLAIGTILSLSAHSAWAVSGCSDEIADYIAQNGSPEDNQAAGRTTVCERVRKLDSKVFERLVRDGLCKKVAPAPAPPSPPAAPLE